MRHVDDERLLAYTLMHLGQAHCALGDYSSAQHFFTENLALHQRHGIRLGVGFAFLGLAEVAAGAGNYAEAYTYAQQAFLECAAVDLRRCMAESLERLAHWAFIRAQPVPATTLLGAVEALRTIALSRAATHRTRRPTARDGLQENAQIAGRAAASRYSAVLGRGCTERRAYARMS